MAYIIETRGATPGDWEALDFPAYGVEGVNSFPSVLAALKFMEDNAEDPYDWVYKRSTRSGRVFELNDQLFRIKKH